MKIKCGAKNVSNQHSIFTQQDSLEQIASTNRTKYKNGNRANATSKAEVRNCKCPYKIMCV